MIREAIIKALGGQVICPEVEAEKPKRVEVGFGHVTITSKIEVLEEHPTLGTFRITQDGINALGWIRVMFLRENGTWYSRFVSYRDIADLAQGPNGCNG
jgi:hypothetical protein